jgi:hypothetical protein
VDGSWASRWARWIVGGIMLAVLVAAIVALVLSGVPAALIVLVAGGVVGTGVALVLGVLRA